MPFLSSFTFMHQFILIKLWDPPFHWDCQIQWSLGVVLIQFSAAFNIFDHSLLIEMISSLGLLLAPLLPFLLAHWLILLSLVFWLLLFFCPTSKCWSASNLNSESSFVSLSYSLIRPSHPPLQFERPCVSQGTGFSSAPF